MSRFGAFSFKKVDNLDKVRLLEPLVYFSDYGKDVYIVPSGFSSDLVSFPRVLNWLRWLFVLDESVDRCAVLHDYLSRSRKDLSYYTVDRVFLESLHLSNAHTIQKYVFFLYVFLGHQIKQVFTGR